VRVVFEHVGEHALRWAAISAIAAKIGRTAETLRDWVRQAERDQGKRSGPTTDEQERIKALEREGQGHYSGGDGHYPQACASRLPAAWGGLPPEAAGSCVDGGFAGADHQIREFPFDAVLVGHQTAMLPVDGVDPGPAVPILLMVPPDQPCADAGLVQPFQRLPVLGIEPDGFLIKLIEVGL
jgi:hypothetical protein